jgi:hypothetical protein
MRLEAFDASLRGHRLLVVGGIDTWLSRIATLESETLYKGRSILVIQEGRESPNPLLFKKRWDVIFRIRESFELQMLATYVANAPKPIRILWTPLDSAVGCEIPRNLWQKWNKQDITLIGGSENGILGCEWEAIIFPFNYPQEDIERVLSSRGSGIAAMAVRFREYMPEITKSEAALAWTSINEGDAKGALYWYDPSDGKTNASLYTKKEASILLDSLSKWIQGS